jgi:hypothetical protein
VVGWGQEAGWDRAPAEWDDLAVAPERVAARDVEEKESSRLEGCGSPGDFVIVRFDSFFQLSDPSLRIPGWKRGGRDETDLAMDYADRNRCGEREAIHQEARKPISQEPSVIHTNGVSVLSFAAHLRLIRHSPNFFRGDFYASANDYGRRQRSRRISCASRERSHRYLSHHALVTDGRTVR